MKRFAEQTTIHGIREAYSSSLAGRLVWAILFVICFAGMFFQLHDLCRSFVNVEIGTRMSPRTENQDISLPSFYFCPTIWRKPGVSLTQGKTTGIYSNLNKSEPSMQDDLYSTVLNELFVPLGSTNDAKSEIYHRHIKDMIAWYLYQELIDGYLKPAHHKELPRYGTATIPTFAHLLLEFNGGNLDKVEEDLHTIFANFTNDLECNNGSLISLIQGTNGQCQQRWSVGYPRPYFVNFLEYQPVTNKRVSVNLNGVCLEVRPNVSNDGITPLRLALDSELDFKVDHTGNFLASKALISYFREIGSRELEWNYGDRIDYTRLYPRHSFAAIGKQSNTELFFQNLFKIHSDENSRTVAKYWGRKSVRISRPGSLCRHWSLLDQAHCNNQGRQVGECLHYLPASENYEETPISLDTCHYYSAVRHYRYSPDVDQMNITPSAQSPMLLSGVLKRLTRSTRRCPQPCVTDVFNLISTISTDARISESDIEFWKDNIFGHDDNVAFFTNPYVGGAKYAPYFNNSWIWKKSCPYTVVTFIPAEYLGHELVEFPRYTLADLAASVGGTVGFWIGASIISFIQAIHIFLLEKCGRRRRFSDDRKDLSAAESGILLKTLEKPFDHREGRLSASFYEIDEISNY